MVVRKQAPTRGARRPHATVGHGGHAGTTRPRPAAALEGADPTRSAKSARWAEQLDPNMRRLVAALNPFRGIHTIGSCGGHEHPGPAQRPAGSWYVKFAVARTDDGWFALEFRAGFVNNDYRRAGHRVMLYPTAAPPYLNTPGQCLCWALEGYESEDPDRLAEIATVHKDSYVSPREVAQAAREYTRRRRRTVGNWLATTRVLTGTVTSNRSPPTCALPPASNVAVGSLHASAVRPTGAREPGQAARGAEETRWL